MFGTVKKFVAQQVESRDGSFSKAPKSTWTRADSGLQASPQPGIWGKKGKSKVTSLRNGERAGCREVQRWAGTAWRLRYTEHLQMSIDSRQFRHLEMPSKLLHKKLLSMTFSSSLWAEIAMSEDL